MSPHMFPQKASTLTKSSTNLTAKVTFVGIVVHQHVILMAVSRPEIFATDSTHTANIKSLNCLKVLH